MEAEYIEIEGKRRGSRLFAANGYAYTSYRTNGNIAYLRCHNYYKSRNQCKGFARMYLDKKGKLFEILGTHSCPKNEEKLLAMDAINDMKSMAMETAKKFRSIYDEVTLDMDPKVKALLDYPKIANVLYKLRRLRQEEGGKDKDPLKDNNHNNNQDEKRMSNISECLADEEKLNELEEVRSSYGECRVCHRENETPVALLPCRHSAVCHGCARKSGGKCPLCDERVVQIIKLR